MVWYVTREAVKAALESTTAINDRRIDAAIDAASRSVENLCHRKFYPTTATRYFTWPDPAPSRSWRLWLNQDEIISVDTLTSGGVTIADTDYFLEPVNDGPPYDRIEIDLDSASAFTAGATQQRAVAVTGTFGYTNTVAPAGTLTAGINASTTAVSVSDSAAVGVGDLVTVGTERMLVTGKAMVDSGQDCSALNAQQNSVSITGVSGLNVGEVILVDSERMLVVDVAGTTVTVKRAWDGTVLAAHSSGAGIYAARGLTVVRGATGSTAASHDSADAVSRWVPPALVAELTLAEAINNVLQAASGYARIVGPGDGSNDARSAKGETSGRGLPPLRRACRQAHGRFRLEGI